jgi:hypothetical protein
VSTRSSAAETRRRFVIPHELRENHAIYFPHRNAEIDRMEDNAGFEVLVSLRLPTAIGRAECFDERQSLLDNDVFAQCGDFLVELKFLTTIVLPCCVGKYFDEQNRIGESIGSSLYQQGLATNNTQIRICEEASGRLHAKVAAKGPASTVHKRRPDVAEEIRSNIVMLQRSASHRENLAVIIFVPDVRRLLDREVFVQTVSSAGIAFHTSIIIEKG